MSEPSWVETIEHLREERDRLKGELAAHTECDASKRYVCTECRLALAQKTQDEFEEEAAEWKARAESAERRLESIRARVRDLLVAKDAAMQLGQIDDVFLEPYRLAEAALREEASCE